MTSTMSLAARICSRRCGGMRPATAGSLLAAHHSVNVPLAASGHAIVTAQGEISRRSRLDKKAPEIFVRSLTGERLFKDRCLNLVDAREEIASEIVFHVFFVFRDFLRRVVGSVQDADKEKKDATETHHACKHAAVKLDASEHVALHHFLAKASFEEGEHEFQDQRDDHVAEHAITRPAEQRSHVQ